MMTPQEHLEYSRDYALKPFTGIEVNGIKFSNVQEMLVYMDKLREENASLKKHNEKLTALINAERERQEKCNDIHLRTIAELEKENEGLKETIRKGTSCGDWNDDVHTCQMYLKQEQLQECINQLTKARKLIQKMKCCENCKYNFYWGNEIHCNFGLKEALQKDKLVECKNMNKWEVKE